MPRKKQLPFNWGKAEWVGFSNVNLSQTDKEHIKDKETLNEEQLYKFLLDSCDSGYRVSCAWSEKDSAYFVSLFGLVEGSSNPGRMLTARHTDLIVALSALRFKHVEMRDSGQWEVENGKSDAFDW